MKLVDANVLLYAVNADAPQHEPARRWLDDALGGQDTVGFTWIVVLAFLRISTRAGIFPEPLEVATAASVVRGWLSAPTAVVVEPTIRHLDVLEDLLGVHGAGGNLVSDAHLAALANEHRGTVVTFDGDFSRFGVATHQPGAR